MKVTISTSKIDGISLLRPEDIWKEETHDFTPAPDVSLRIANALRQMLQDDSLAIVQVVAHTSPRKSVGVRLGRGMPIEVVVSNLAHAVAKEVNAS